MDPLESHLGTVVIHLNLLQKTVGFSSGTASNQTSSIYRHKNTKHKHKMLAHVWKEKELKKDDLVVEMIPMIQIMFMLFF